MEPPKLKDLSELKVALVHDSLTVPGGAENVLLELHKLFPNAPIYTPLYRPEKFPEFKSADVRVSPLNRWSYARNHHQVMIPLLPYQFEQFDLSEFDLVISNSSAVAKGVITRPETLHISYCHTPMRWAWLSDLDRRASSSFIRRLVSHYLRIWDVSSTNRVDVFFSNSLTTASRINKFYRREATHIYPPASIEDIKPSETSEDFYLTVGRLLPKSNKRSEIIVEAAMKLGIKLKVVGTGPLLNDLKKMSQSHSDIEYLGYVSNEKRDELYTKCRAFIFASEEDAGIVPIEAMAYGKPVIAYSKGGAAETVIDRKTGLHFSEPSASSLVLAIKESQDINFDAHEIAKHAQHFSATRFRDRFMTEVVKQVELWSKKQYGMADE